MVMTCIRTFSSFLFPVSRVPTYVYGPLCSEKQGTLGVNINIQKVLIFRTRAVKFNNLPAYLNSQNILLS